MKTIKLMLLDKIIFLILVIMLFESSTAESQIVRISPDNGTKKFIEAESYYDAGLYRKSEELIVDMLDRFPLSPAADHAALRRAYLDIAAGNNAIAEAELTELIETRANSPLKASAALLRGYSSFDSKDYDEAEKFFLVARNIAEENFTLRNDSLYLDYAHRALYWRGVSFALKGKYQDAQPVFEECFRKYPNYEFADDAIFALGTAAEVAGQSETAITYYNTIIKKYPKSNTYLASRLREINGRLAVRDGATALVSIQNAESMLEHIDAHDSIGNSYERQSFADNAKEELLYLKGEAYNITGAYDQAISIYNQYFNSYSGGKIRNYALLSAGWALLNTSSYEKALAMYDELLQKDTVEDSRLRATAALYRTITLKKRGDTALAQKELSALSVEASYPFAGHALLELGQIYYESGAFDRAERTLERAEREATDATVAVRIHTLLGAVYIEGRKWDKAISQYRTAEQLAIKSPIKDIPQKNWIISEARLKQAIANIQNHRYIESTTILLNFLAEEPVDGRRDEALFWLAEAYYRSDMLKNAIETYNSLLENYPRSVRCEEALYGKGWANFRLKNFTESSQIFEKMVKEFPDSKFSVEALSREGDGYYLQKNYRRAVEPYKRASELAIKTEEGQYCAYQHANVLYRLGDYENALNALFSFAKLYPKSTYAPYTFYLAAWIKFQQKKYKESIDNFKYLISAYPSSDLIGRAHFAIGDAYYNLNLYESALGAYRTVIESYPGELAPEALKSVQYCLMSLGREEEAYKIADQFIQSNPNSPYAPDFFLKKGEMKFSNNDFTNAASEYENFIKKYPESEKIPEALYWMGKSYINLGESNKAEDIMVRLEKNYPKSDFAPYSLLDLGLMYATSANYDKALSFFERIQKDYPQHSSAARAGFERAAIKFTLGDTVASIDQFKDVVQLYDGSEYSDQARYRLGMYYRYKSINDTARFFFDKLAIRSDIPDMAAEAQYLIGGLWMRDENYEEAAKSFLLLREHFPGIEDWFSLALLNLGECYQKLGRDDAALEAYQALSDLRPEDDFGKTAKRRIKDMKK